MCKCNATNDSIDDLTSLDASVEDMNHIEAFNHRIEIFERVYEYLNEPAPEHLAGFTPSPIVARRPSNEDELLKLIQAETIPWITDHHEPENCPRGVNDDFGTSIFFKSCSRILQHYSEHCSKTTVQELHRSIDEAEETANNPTENHHHADGTEHQIEKAAKYKIRTYQWLLGEYNGV